MTPDGKKTVAVVAPVWRRSLLFALWRHHMACHKVIADALGIDLHIIPVVSDWWYPQGWAHPVHAPNEPLGAKFNAGFHAARDRRPDYVTVIGPDEFFRPTLWDVVAQRVSQGSRFFGFGDVYLFDAVRDKGCYWEGYQGPRRGETIGPARFTHAEILDDVEWSPYDPHLSKSLDASFMRRVGWRSADLIMGGDEVMLTSVKDASAKTPYDGFPNTRPVERLDFHRLFNQFTPEEKE